ncbi:MAG TPA: Mur ligase domain-containing protein, partial [Acidobacteriota bacterium]|nr:Mur ligase domain-containing protein [Acidobacteriota bacterium]
MNLKKLLSALQKYEAGGSIDIELTGLSYDSRKTKKGHLFFALPGLHHHGLNYLAEAEKAGAVAVLSDRPPKKSALPYV